MKEVDSTQRTRRSYRAPRTDDIEEISARSDVWDGYDKKVMPSGSTSQFRPVSIEKQKRTLEEDKATKQQLAPLKTAEEKTKKGVERTESHVDFFEALKKPPPDVDLNCFVVKAAIAQTVVNPLLVKKVGNIDDEQADPKKLKEQIDKLDEQMKSNNDSLKEMKKESPKPSPQVKWGDDKCVLYETRDQTTLEDDAEDAGDLV